MTVTHLGACASYAPRVLGTFKGPAGTLISDSVSRGKAFLGVQKHRKHRETDEPIVEKLKCFCSSKFHDIDGVTRILPARRQKHKEFKHRHHQNTGETAILDSQLRNSL